MKTLIRTFVLLFSLSAQAKIDLVTLPARKTVQVTIYNSADLTLVRESRELTLGEGMNRLQFSWANTLIDPTSLSMAPLAHADQIDVFDVSFPPRAPHMGVWTIHSEVAGKTPMKIDYLTSGLSWRAFYMATLSADESHMHLQGYVRVTNNSGEDYENAETRLIVGKVHLLDEIAALAQRTHAFGRPNPRQTATDTRLGRRAEGDWYMNQLFNGFVSGGMGGGGGGQAAKEIRKEGLSEYFLYTIEGTETIRHGWSKRLPSFKVETVPVKNLYKYDEDRYGRQAVRFIEFKNDEAHQLGDTPIPGGLMKVFRTVDDQRHLAYEGQSEFKYIPVDEDVELNLGLVGNVTVEPVLMDYQTMAYEFNHKGNISGWHELRKFKVTVKNTRAVPVKVQVDRNFSTAYWNAERAGAFGEYEKIDLDTVRFTLELDPESKKVFEYTLTTRHGTQEK